MALLRVLHGLEQLRPENDIVLGRLRDRRIPERGDRVLEELSGLIAGAALQGRPQQSDSLQQLALEVVLGGDEFALELVAPGSEHVGPGLHRVLIPAGARDVEAPGPPDPVQVRVDPLQLGLLPAPLARLAVTDHGLEQLVAVPEDVGQHLDAIAHAPLGRKAAEVDRRRGVLDDDAGWDTPFGPGSRPGLQARLRAGHGTGHTWTLSTPGIDKPRRFCERGHPADAAIG